MSAGWSIGASERVCRKDSRRPFVAELTVGLVILALANGSAGANPPSGESPAKLHLGGWLQATLREEKAEALLTNRAMRNSWDYLALFANADVTVSDHVALFARVSLDDQMYKPVNLDGAYLMVHHFLPTDLFVELGKIPATFGTFQERSYPDKNPLVGLPFLYYHHSTIRWDRVPMSIEDLYAVRGWTQQGFVYPSDSQSGRPLYGMPSIYDPCWDVGLAVLGTWRSVEYRLGIMNGPPGWPETSGDPNHSKTPMGRLGWAPAPWLRIGASAGRGAYLTDGAKEQLPPGKSLRDYHQTVLGGDLEVSRGFWDLHAEVARVAFESPYIPGDLESTTYYVEARRKLSAGLYAAARFDEILYTKHLDPTGGKSPWDWNRRRIEMALGYWAAPGFLLKADMQLNAYADEGFESELILGGLQAIVMF